MDSPTSPTPGRRWRVQAVEVDEDPRVVVVVTAEDTPYCATGVDLVADRLFGLGASAVSEMPETGGLGTRLVADLPGRSIDVLSSSGVDFEVVEVDPTWSEGWRSHAEVVPVGDRLLVRPEWVARDADLICGRAEVVVDAADAFGSGSHPTTRLCLAALERLVTAGEAVLDVGCGTGVLGIAALLLGAGSLVAVDVDPAAAAATLGTARLNGVAARVTEVSLRPLPDVTDELGPFDLVLANLLIPTIEGLGHDLPSAVAAGGHLVMSGLLPEHVDRAVAAVGADPAQVEVLEEDGWAAVVLAPMSC